MTPDQTGVMYCYTAALTLRNCKLSFLHGSNAVRENAKALALIKHGWTVLMHFNLHTLTIKWFKITMTAAVGIMDRTAN
jgi:hypothetical protein